MSFMEKLRTAHLPLKEIEVKPTYYYLRHDRKAYVVTKLMQHERKRSFLYFKSTTDCKVAQRYSVRMCELINEEIRRRACSLK